MNVIVLGAGAIGSLYAAKLAACHDVTVIGRQAHVDAINHDGLRVVGHEELTPRVRAATAVESIVPDTLIVLTTKATDSRAAVAAIAEKVRDDTIILCVQNGLHSEEVVRSVVDGRCLVLRAVTHFGAIFRAPGVIDFKVPGYTIIEAGPRSTEVADMLTSCGLDGRVSDCIKVDVWRKLIFNCVVNPITSIVGCEVGGIADPRLDPVKRLVIDECVQVARADGVEFDGDFLPTIAHVFAPSRNVASMRQDLLRGKATEIDFMNGAVVDLGRRAGIPCPVNAALVALIKAMEARGMAQ